MVAFCSRSQVLYDPTNYEVQLLKALSKVSKRLQLMLYLVYVHFRRQVKQLHMDKQVLEAHEAATKALRSCREAHGLTVERVEDTLDALAEVTYN